MFLVLSVKWLPSVTSITQAFISSKFFVISPSSISSWPTAMTSLVKARPTGESIRLNFKLFVAKVLLSFTE